VMDFILVQTLFLLAFCICLCSPLENNHRQLISFNPVVDIGDSIWLRNKTIHSAYLKWCENSKSSPKSHSKKTHCRDHIPSLNETAFPFPIVHWNSINTRPCPQIPNDNHRTEHGHGMSHLQIWLEFYFFDHDVLMARVRPKPEYVVSTTYSSVSGTFQAFENGTLYKNGILFTEDDILLVLEDSIDLSHVQNNTVILQELQSELIAMTTDLLRIGWCASEHNKPQSHHGNNSSSSSNSVHRWCSFAYAITRAGARKLSQQYDLCGKPLDVQIQSFVQAGLLTMALSTTNITTQHQEVIRKEEEA